MFLIFGIDILIMLCTEKDKEQIYNTSHVSATLLGCLDSTFAAKCPHPLIKIEIGTSAIFIEYSKKNCHLYLFKFSNRHLGL